MSTLVQDLNTLQDARDDMKTALENKGMTVTNDIRTYAEVIANIPSGSGGGDVKLFDTVEHMQADPNPSEGDLAVVYREELTAVTAESEFDSCTFPNEVILDEAFTDSIYGSFRAVDSSSSYFDGMVDMSSSSFRFDGYGDDGEIRVEYESDDGITYTRTDGGAELQEFGVIVKWEDYGEGFNSVIGNFMKIGGNYFEGLFEYKDIVEGNEIVLPNISDIDNIENNICYITQSYTHIYNLAKTHSLIEKVYAENYNSLNYIEGSLFLYNNSLCYLMASFTSGNTCDGFSLEINTSLEMQNTLIGASYSDNISIANIKLYVLDLLSQSYTIQDVSSLGNVVSAGAGGGRYTIRLNLTPQTIPINIRAGIYDDVMMSSLCAIRTGDNYLSIPFNSNNGIEPYKHKHYIYTEAESQLDAVPEYVYNKVFYGNDGVAQGTLGNPVVNTKDEAVIDVELYSKLSKLDLGNIGSNLSSFSNLFTNKLNVVYVPRFINTYNITDVSLMFSECNNLLEIYEFDTANVTNMRGFFHFCSNLRNIPNFNTINVTDTSLMFCSCKNIIDLPDIDTTKVTNMSAMFDFCVNITAMPLYNTSNVTDFSYFARSCYNLVNIPIIDTSNAIYMRAMFANCWNLVDIPELDTHSVRSLTYMFHNCNNLSNSAIQNIVNMCLNCNITNSNYMNLNNTNSNSPLYETKFNSMYYSNRLSELSSAGWSY